MGVLLAANPIRRKELLDGQTRCRKRIQDSRSCSTEKPETRYGTPPGVPPAALPTATGRAELKHSSRVKLGSAGGSSCTHRSAAAMYWVSSSSDTAPWNCTAGPEPASRLS